VFENRLLRRIFGLGRGDKRMMEKTVCLYFSLIIVSVNSLTRKDKSNCTECFGSVKCWEFLEWLGNY
jgi:hypothetical protein